MQKTACFNNLNDLAGFLNKPIFYQKSNIVLNHYHFYRLNGSATILINGNNYALNFLGTNHTRKEKLDLKKEISEILEPSDSEKQSIEEFVKDIPGKSTVLIEQGCDKKGRVTDNIRADLKNKYESDSLQNKLNESDVFIQMGELDYASNLTIAKDCNVKNIDIVLNPKAVVPLINKMGFETAVSELKRSMYIFFKNEKASNTYVQELLKSQGIDTKKRNIEIIKSIDKSRDSLITDDMRDKYMSEVVVRELNPDKPIYIITHTAHILGILKNLEHNGGKILSLNAKLDYTPEKEYEIEGVKEAYRGMLAILKILMLN